MPAKSAGRRGVRRLAAEDRDAWSEPCAGLEPIEIRPLETSSAPGLPGAEVSRRLAFVLSGFRDRTFSEVRAFQRWHDALEAVGLEE